MKADYERQIAALSDVLERLTAERAELANGVDNEHPALVAFMKYQNIDKLTREALIDLVDPVSYTHLTGWPPVPPGRPLVCEGAPRRV